VPCGLHGWKTAPVAAELRLIWKPHQGVPRRGHLCDPLQIFSRRYLGGILGAIVTAMDAASGSLRREAPVLF
jgi:hypothetical protein